MRLRLFTGVTALLTLAEAQPAFACSNNGLNSISFTALAPATQSWNPLPGGQAVLYNFTVNVERKGDTRSVRLIFVDNETGPVRLSQAGPPYEVVLSSGTDTYAYPANTTAAAAARSIIINLPDNKPVSTSLQVRVPANSGDAEYTGGMTFREDLKYSVQCYKTENAVTADGPGQSGVAVSPEVTIPRVLSASITGQTTSGEVDFGNFASLTPAPLAINLRSTSSISVRVSTASGLQMVRIGAPATPAANDVIPYTLSLNNQPVTTSPFTYTASRVGVAQRTWNLQLGLPTSPAGKRAGAYSDTITIELSPSL
jgi:hypothetical protein